MRTTGDEAMNGPMKSGPVPQWDGAGSLARLYQMGREALSRRETGDSPMEAAFLFRKVFGLDRGSLAVRGEERPDPKKTEDFLSLLGRRLTGEPLQYLLGEWEFLGLPFFVGPGVLIPRPETELLAETALAMAEGLPSPALLDLCSGSGCLPIALGHFRPDADVWGVELSPDAMGYFRRNLERGGGKNVTAVLGDVFALPEEITGRRYQVITANPPYIRRDALPGLQEEVRHEPVMALDGGEDGLKFYRRLPGIGRELLAPGGALLMEIGDDQGEAVSALMGAAGYRDVTVKKDLSGMDRVVLGKQGPQ